MFREFQFGEPLGEGQNIITVEAVQPYTPFLSDTDQVSGFADTTAPVVTLTGVPAKTNTLLQTLTGTIADTTLKQLVIDQITPGATTTIFSLQAVPANGTFSVPVSLVNGKNTFRATATDDGTLTTIVDLVSIADIAPPTITDDGAIGAVSARAGDEMIFQVTADDGSGEVSGVQKVELLVAGQVQSALLPASAIPQIVRDKFDITGNFVLFVDVPTGTPPGEFAITVRATDNAGNSADTTVTGSVTASLKAQNIFLGAGANLVGISLQASGGATQAFDTKDVVAQELDTSFLNSVFVSSLRAALGSTTSTSSSIAGGSTVDLADATGFEAGDRIAVGAGDTLLTADATSSTAVLPVGDTTGFAVGQTIVISGSKGPFGLGFQLTEAATATSTITAIDAGNDLITISPVLALTQFQGSRVTGIQHARIASLSGSTITIDCTFLIEPPSGTAVNEEPKLEDLIDSIFFFTGGQSVGNGASQGVFQQFIPGPAADTLTELKQGRGYWFITKLSAFDTSTPLPGFLEEPTIPVRMQLDGVVFDPTGTPPSLPATVVLDKAGWHQIALISEVGRPVERGIRGVLFPTRLFTSLIEFQKFIQFTAATGDVQIVDGVFNSLFAGDIATPGDTMESGRGFYIFMNAAGTHTP